MAEECELSDGESIIIIDSADPVYISFYSSFPMLTTVPKTDRKTNSERQDVESK